MAEKNDIIEILFAVEGGDSIKIGSGKKILDDLTSIKQQVEAQLNLKIGLDADDFTKQLLQLKKEVDKVAKATKSININQDTKLPSEVKSYEEKSRAIDKIVSDLDKNLKKEEEATRARAKNTKAVEDQIKAFKELKKRSADYYNAANKYEEAESKGLPTKDIHKKDMYSYKNSFELQKKYFFEEFNPADEQLYAKQKENFGDVNTQLEIQLDLKKKILEATKQQSDFEKEYAELEKQEKEFEKEYAELQKEEEKEQDASFENVKRKIKEAQDLRLKEIKELDENSQKKKVYSEQATAAEEEAIKAREEFLNKWGNRDLAPNPEKYKKQLEEISKIDKESENKINKERAIAEAKKADAPNKANKNKVKDQIKEYNDLKKIIKEVTQLEIKAKKEKAQNGKSKKYLALKEQFDEKNGKFLEKFNNFILKNESEIADVTLYKKQRQDVIDLNSELKRSVQLSEELALVQNNDKLVPKKTSFLGLIANVESLNERYIDLIKHNKDAAAAMERLKAASSQQFLGEDHYDDKGNFVEANYNAAQNQITSLAQLTKETSAVLSELEAKSDNVFTKLRKNLSSNIIHTFAYALIGLATRAFKQVYQNVLELDRAITNLQVASGKTREETTKLISSYAKLGKQLGATVTEVADAADVWLRQGYSLEETNTLISNSMKLSKLGQMQSAEATKALTSAMKGYKVEVSDCLGIVDKLVSVDMVAATSSGEIATAMAETAASANITGVSMDRLIGYIATVKEVTQDGAESVGK